jgi:hypothetical protein
MLQLIKNIVSDYQQEHDLGVPDLQNILCLNTGFGHVDGCCCLIFGKDQNFPLLVAKAALTPFGQARLENELTSLQQLQQKGMNAHRQMVPKHLGDWREQGALITLQTALQGTVMKYTPAQKLFSRAQLPKTLESVLRWLFHFEEVFGVRKTALTDEVYEKNIIRPLKQFQRRFRLNQNEIELLNRRFLVEKTMLDVDLPFMVRHTDFSAGNIICQPVGLGVIDWEFPLVPQLPLYDLFMFFSSLRFPFAGLQGEVSHFGSFVQVFWGDSYFNRAMRRSIHQTCCRFAIPLECVADLFLMALIETANMTFDSMIKHFGRHIERAGDVHVSRVEYSAQQQSSGLFNQDTPFATVKNGVLENIRFVAHHGLPDFGAQ